MTGTDRKLLRGMCPSGIPVDAGYVSGELAKKGCRVFNE
jgi:hypothetical protein